VSIATGPDHAQCETCGGLLAPAGDDWTHVDSTTCTSLATPLVCWRGDCAMPADIGCLACRTHAGVFA
jgi:hypothetical protein